MKTNKITESISELRDFVATQAAEDAVLDASERRYQADLVKDVLNHEPLKASMIKELIGDYSKGVASRLKSQRALA